MDVEVNTYDFITEIEHFPAIWDVSSKEYSNKQIKKNSWEQVIIKFCPDFKEKADAEKTAIGLRFQRKWKSLRDSYMRELAKRKKEKSGSDTLGRKQYIYFKQLSFLQSSQKETTSSTLEGPAESQADVTQQNNTADDKEESEVPERPMHPKAPRKRKSTSIISKEAKDSLFIAVANKIMKDKSETERDEDTLFMLSLVPELKKIPDDRKLDVKAEILGVFQKFKRNEYYPVPPPQHFQHHQHFVRPQPSTSTMPYTGTAHHYPIHTATPLQSPTDYNSLSSASSPAPASPQSQYSFIDF